MRGFFREITHPGRGTCTMGGPGIGEACFRKINEVYSAGRIRVHAYSFIAAAYCATIYKSENSFINIHLFAVTYPSRDLRVRWQWPRRSRALFEMIHARLYSMYLIQRTPAINPMNNHVASRERIKAQLKLAERAIDDRWFCNARFNGIRRRAASPD